MVTRQLEIRYLWIDCYCIVQTGGIRTEEQEQEIARMGEIYTNALLNIAAAAATSPLDGCFIARTTARPIQIDFKSRRIGGPAKATSYIVYEEDQLNGLLEDAPKPRYNSMFKRAWCLQERLLASRMLHFGHSGMFWECDEVSLMSDRLPIPRPSRRIRYLPRAPPPFSLPKSSDYSVEDCQQLWCQIVSMYSTMTLSYPEKDKLAACAGVAKRMEPLLGPYVLGFFRQSLLSMLSWRVDTYAGTRSRSATWRAPSWSWASIDGRISMDCSAIMIPRAEVVDLTYDFAEALNPSSELKIAVITIKGLTKNVRFDIVDDKYCVFSNTLISGSPSMEVVFDDYAESRKHLVILVIDLVTISGLVLAPVKKRRFKQPDLYRRVGAFWKPYLMDERIMSNLVERVVSII